MGNSGLLVSILSLGTANIHNLFTFEQQVELVKNALQNGINLFDTAEMYSAGKDEEDFGKVLKAINEPRERLVITAKVWTSPDPDINSKGNTNRKNIKESLKASLKRLQLDYVDVAFAHSYDPNTPLEETVRAFHEVIEEGLTFYWGTSNWDADKIYEAIQICEKYNLHKPIAAENQYNMINRAEIEIEYRTLFEKHHYGLIAYAPLLGGYLTGKYLDGAKEGRLESGAGFFTKELAQYFFFHGMDREKTD